MMTIEVRGIPGPQGSKTKFPNGGMKESSARVGPWRDAVRTEVQRLLGLAPSGYAEPELPVAVQIDFYLPRPKTLPKRIKLPAKKKDDIDKLARATLDGLVDGGVLHDDGQVTTLNLTKSFASDIRPAGACILIELDHDLDSEESPT